LHRRLGPDLTWCPLCGLDYVIGEGLRPVGIDCPVCKGDSAKAFAAHEELQDLLARADTLSDEDLDLIVRHIDGGWLRAKFRELLEARGFEGET
jgi:hypothetical protein